MAWCEICGSLAYGKDAKGKPICKNPHCGESPNKTEKDSVANREYATMIDKIEKKISTYKPIYSDEIFEFKKLLDDTDLNQRVKLNLEKIVQSGEYVCAPCISGGKHIHVYGDDPGLKAGPRTYSLNVSCKDVVCNKQKDCIFIKKNEYQCIFYPIAKDVLVAKQVIKNQQAGILLS